MWSMPVDLYCERVDPSFWAEPINALTNLGFLLAAAGAYALWRRETPRDWSVLALIVVTFVVGLGSFAFHTLATRGAVLLDIVPIAFFIYGYFALALIRFLRLPILPALLILIAFIVVSQGIDAMLPRGFLNGSGGYLPALAAMLVIGGLSWGTAPGRAILIAAAVFAVSLLFRTIDRDVCGAFPLGTHFIWHTLNAVVLYLLLRAAITQRARQDTGKDDVSGRPARGREVP